MSPSEHKDLLADFGDLLKLIPKAKKAQAFQFAYRVEMALSSIPHTDPEPTGEPEQREPK